MSNPAIGAENVAQRTETLSGYLWALRVALLAAAITMIPYIAGAAMAYGRRYMWLGYNLDDSCVYLSWMKQAAAGHFHALNLFTTEPQQSMTLNPLFLVLGRVAAVTGIPPIGVYHAARVMFGVMLIVTVWGLARSTISGAQERKMALLFVCFSAGIGWLPCWWDASPLQTPIDKWQPEAITFLSLYLSPLFCFSMLLQTSIFLLLRAAEQTGRMRLTVAAGLCGLLLSLVHTYDIISVSVVWLAYRAVMLAGDIRARRAFTVRPWVDMVTTAAITAPGVLTVYLQLHSNPVFAARANVETLSAGLTWVFAGYGLTLLLAVAGAAAALRARSSRESTPPNVNGAVFLAVWGIANVAAGYLPFPFQRKMLQGAHIPIALLAGIGAAWLLRASRIGVRGGQAVIASVGLTVLLAVTNLRFLLRDIDNYAANDAQTHQQRPYMQPGEIVALRWIERSTPAGAAIQPLPWLAFGPNGGYGTYDSTVACVAPGLTGRAVYCGHWGETPSFSAKLADLRSVEVPTTPDSERLALLRRMRVGYILFTQKSPRDSDADALAPMFRGHGPLPAYLKLVYSNADADVYRVDLPAT